MGEIETLNTWYEGNVYGYVVTRNGETVDSCWGFFGYYDEPNGALAEGRDVALHHAARTLFPLQSKTRG